MIPSLAAPLGEDGEAEEAGMVPVGPEEQFQPAAIQPDAPSSLRLQPSRYCGGGPGRGHRASGYSRTRGGPTAGLYPSPSHGRPDRPSSTAARTDPTEPVAGPPRRAAVDVSALERNRVVWSPGRGAPGGGRLLGVLVFLLLLPPPPAGAWYKHVASPRYHTVGRAAGLLMGLRRSPYMWRRALRPAAGPLVWDSVAPGPAARDALLLLPLGVRELWEARLRSLRVGLPIREPRSLRALELEPRLGIHSWTSEVSARAFGETSSSSPRSLQQMAFASPAWLQDGPESIHCPRRPCS